MSPAVRPVPEGFHTITPALTCKDAARAIQFYKDAFGAVERVRMDSPDGKVTHAELQIGDSILFLGDEFPGMSAAPEPYALPSSYFYLYVDNVDTSFERAVSAGCNVVMPLTDMFWGDRYGKVADPFGHHWGISSHVEDVSPEEMERRGAEWMAKFASSTKPMAATAGQD